MKSATIESLAINDLGLSCGESIRLGWIVRISQEGRPVVDFDGNQLGPLEARTLIDRPPRPSSGSVDRLPVLLVFDRRDPTSPIIVGVIRESFVPSAALDARPTRLVLDAEEEVVIRSGNSSLTLQNNGNIITKGTRIVSRASRTNKIRGAAVRIN